MFETIGNHFPDFIIVAIFLIVFYLIKKSRKKPLPPKRYEYKEDSLVKYNKIIKEVLSTKENMSPQTILNEMEMKNLKPDSTTFNTLIDIEITKGRYDSADSLLGIMREKGVKLDLVTYNTLIKKKALESKSGRKCHKKNFDEAFDIIREMEENHILINIITINTLLDCCVFCRSIDYFENVYLKMKESHIKPDEITFGTIIKGIRNLEEPKDKEKIMFILEKMLEDTNKENEHSINALLNGLFAIGDSQRILFLYSKLSKNEVSLQTSRILLKGFSDLKMERQIIEIYESLKGFTDLDELTLSYLVNALVKIEKIKEARELIFKSENANTITYSILIKGLAKNDIIQHALDLIEEMKQNPKLKPNLVTYNTLLDAAVSQEDYTLMKKIYSEMKACDVGVDLISVSTYIKGLFRAGECDEALNFFYQCRENPKLKVDEIIYNIAMDGLVRVGQYEKAISIFSDMQKDGFTPSNVTYSIMVRAESGQRRLDEALSILNTMKEKGMSPGKVVYTCILKACVKFKKINIMLQVYKEMIDTGVRPDTVLFNTVIYGLLSVKEYLEAGLVLLNSLKEGPIVKSEMINKVIEALCIYIEKKGGENEEGEKLLLQICIELRKKNEEINGDLLRRVVRFLCKKNCSNLKFLKEDKHIPKFINRRKNNENTEGNCNSSETSDMKSVQLSDLMNDEFNSDLM